MVARGWLEVLVADDGGARGEGRALLLGASSSYTIHSGSREEVACAGWWAGSGGDPEEEGTGGVAAARWDRWDKAPRI